MRQIGSRFRGLNLMNFQLWLHVIPAVKFNTRYYGQSFYVSRSPIQSDGLGLFAKTDMEKGTGIPTIVHTIVSRVTLSKTNQAVIPMAHNVHVWMIRVIICDDERVRVSTICNQIEFNTCVDLSDDIRSMAVLATARHSSSCWMIPISSTRNTSRSIPF